MSNETPESGSENAEQAEERPETANQDGGPPEAEHQEPSLGPACVVVGIVSLALMCSICAFGSFFMFSDQYSLAVKGINLQLIPWIKTSQLSEPNQQIIISRLEELIPQLEAESINKQQLTRLHNCLQDNPVLIWGGINSILRQAESAGLSEIEVETLNRVCERLLRAASERKLGRNDVEFAIQNCSKVRPNGQSLDVLEPLTADQIREFMTRAEQLVEQNGIPNEPFNKTAGEAFVILVDAALDVD